jgi:hypothetical protein
MVDQLLEELLLVGAQFEERAKAQLPLGEELHLRRTQRAPQVRQPILFIF